MLQATDADVYLDALDEPANPSRDTMDPDKLSALADDLGANGLLQRIGVRGPSPAERYEVVWGHRRSKAARMLGWITIPARVFPWSTDPVNARLAENLVREDLNPREESRAVIELLKAGKSASEVARIMRRSPPWVQLRADMASWAEELLAAVAAKRIGLGVAKLLTEVDHAGYRAALIEEAARSGATERTVMVWLAHYGAERERIITNHETVESMITRRDVFIVRIQCESCRAEVNAAQTALLRICAACCDQLRAAQAEEDAARGTEQTPA